MHEHVQQITMSRTWFDLGSLSMQFIHIHRRNHAGLWENGLISQNSKSRYNVLLYSLANNCPVLHNRYHMPLCISQAWFINRRRKENKPEQVAPLSFVGVVPSAVAMAASPAMYVVPAIAAQPMPAAVKKVAAPTVPRIPAAPGVHGAAFAAVMPVERNEDYSELIEAAKHTIEGYREDGPVLGFIFDRPPMLTGSKRKNEADLGPLGDFYPAMGPIKVELGKFLQNIFVLIKFILQTNINE